MNSAENNNIPVSAQSSETAVGNNAPPPPVIIYRDSPARIVYRNAPIATKAFAGNGESSNQITANSFNSNTGLLDRSKEISSSNSARIRLASFISPSVIEREYDPDAEPFAHLSTGAESNNFYFTIRGMNSKSYPSTDDKLQTGQGFSNLAIGLFYQFAENHSFGIEIGQEPFTQLINSSDDNVQSEQNPLLFWVGLSYRGTLSKMSFLGDLQPYGQIALGSTQVGPLGKALVGLQYMTISGFGINIGVEGSILYYKNGQTSSNTRKLGLTYGLQYKF
jgi:hypothetical protein